MEFLRVISFCLRLLKIMFANYYKEINNEVLKKNITTVLSLTGEKTFPLSFYSVIFRIFVCYRVFVEQ